MIYIAFLVGHSNRPSLELLEYIVPGHTCEYGLILMMKCIVSTFRVTRRKVSMEADNVLGLDFLDGTVELKVAMVENMHLWDWNCKVSSYFFMFDNTKSSSPAGKPVPNSPRLPLHCHSISEMALYSMIHDWWKVIFPTGTLVKSYPNLKSLQTVGSCLLLPIGVCY